MDSSLLREHEAFKKRAAANVSLGLSDIKSKRPESQADTKPPKAKKPKLESAPKEMNYKAMSGSSDNKFAILAKIVKHLKIRHQKGDSDPLTFEEILDETSQEGISAKNKHWLNTEALKNNPKIEVVHGETYRFKPEFNMREKNGLRKLLDRHSSEGLGGVYMDAIEESLPNYQKHLKTLSESIHRHIRPDKKEVVFNKPVGLPYAIDEEIQKFWRTVSVEGVDPGKIQEYLTKHKISSMQNLGIKKVSANKRRANNKKRARTFKTHNEHMGDVLKDYSEN